MLSVLIIEDDEFKASSLKDFLLTLNQSLAIDTVNNLFSAVSALNQVKFDVVFIDMAIPSHPIKVGENAPKSLLNGGLEILLELSYINSKSNCIVLTQYPVIEIGEVFYSLGQANQQIKEKFYSGLLGCVEYREGENSWKLELKNILENYEHINFRR